MERGGSTRGWGSGLLGVVIFSGSLPATRLALAGFSPLFLTGARAVIAALVGAGLIAMLGERRPGRSDLAPLLGVALGVVVGFPLLSALALEHIPAGRSIVFVGLLPLATALLATVRGAERPGAPFWLFAGLGALVVSGFALAGGGPGTLRGDALMAAAVLACGYGYGEGAALSRRLGGWQVISWALVLSLPASVPIAIATRPDDWAGIGASAWGGLAYVSLFSMLLGFVFWYRGLALGGVAGVSQLQLLQPFFGLGLAALVLGEPIAPAMVAAALGVVACVAGARRFS
ncbi:DMT family transporter [Aureimonas sp. ME7]|uniref:DMT family transporter n=1 Tax=Aureimonas sp. ME7 TaxID=2744252 RepID=UPI0015F4CECA|nr:DMT family transporter [Aureimonas sp. ME7]